MYLVTTLGSMGAVLPRPSAGLSELTSDLTDRLPEHRASCRPAASRSTLVVDMRGSRVVATSHPWVAAVVRSLQAAPQGPAQCTPGRCSSCSPAGRKLQSSRSQSHGSRGKGRVQSGTACATHANRASSSNLSGRQVWHPHRMRTARLCC